jgi:hypothetical protein
MWQQTILLAPFFFFLFSFFLSSRFPCGFFKMEATHRSLQVAAGSNIQSDLKHEARKQASWAVGTLEVFITYYYMCADRSAFEGR